MMRRGGWREAAITQGDVRAMVGIAYAAAVVRAIDYVTGDDPTARANVAAETVMPLCGWAAAIITFLAILTVGWVQRRHALVFAGHFGLAVLYSSLACGLAGSYLADWWSRGLTPWHLDGVRSIGPLLLVATLHAILALRTGTHPIPRVDAVADETVLRDGGGE